MFSHKQLIAIFVPAILLVGLGLFIQIIRYQPLYPETPEETTDTPAIAIPIFPDDPLLGNKKAPITLIAFEDFGCEACALQNQRFDALLEKHPDRLKIIWKGLPVTQFPYPTKAAQKYGYCAHQQGKFSEFKTMAFANLANLSDTTLSTIANELELKENKLNECLESTAAENYIAKVEQIASLLNIQAVPAVFLDGSQVEPPDTVADWEALLQL